MARDRKADRRRGDQPVTAAATQGGALFYSEKAGWALRSSSTTGKFSEPAFGDHGEYKSRWMKNADASTGKVLATSMICDGDATDGRLKLKQESQASNVLGKAGQLTARCKLNSIVIKDRIEKSTIAYGGGVPDKIIDRNDLFGVKFALPAIGAKGGLSEELVGAPALPAGMVPIDAEAAEKRLLFDAAAAAVLADRERADRRSTAALLSLDPAVIPVDTDEQLIEAVARGFPSMVLPALQEAGWSYTAMGLVIAPYRTLMRRKSGSDPLTPAESDAAWRMADTLRLAEAVLASRKAALAWLDRPKDAFAKRSATELLQSSMGYAHVLSLLRKIDAGNLA